ncbi:MAG: hypothetical protein RDU24_10875 [Humidesulfovibrio sp.]|uniref:hypothetical protein n=1 Tax=Humidesulfovibrio sp. TaxID=2910988 RepID=UPI0027FA5C01|nr:hypothetical protein [Humidesulfovibrio sp.]MDQ7835873.1 hypothetical protein [Humidesulfovibrio sp.]
MLITNKALFNKGLLLMASFLCIFVSLFLPIWGGAGNGLDAADNMFNRLSKGSSYFIPGVQKQVADLGGKTVTVTAKVKDAKVAERAVANLTKAGATAELKDGSVTYTGDLGVILSAALADADDLFNDRGKAVVDRYALTDKDGEKAVVKAWWAVLDPSIKELQKQKLIQEAKVVGQVNKRGLEPGYNFYGIKSEKVLDNVLPLVGLLVFYVVYTMWYGYAIFDMFGGIGLGMSKPKIKKEA